MRKEFKAKIPYRAQVIMDGLSTLGNAGGLYRLISAEGNRVTLETGGFTAKEWATSRKATVDPKRMIVTTVKPVEADSSLLTIQITRIGLLDPFGFLEKEFKQFMQALIAIL